MLEINSWDAATASSKHGINIGQVLVCTTSALTASFCNPPHVTSEGELGIEPSSSVVLVAEIPVSAHGFFHGSFRRSFHRLLDSFRAKSADPFAGITCLYLCDVGFSAFLFQSTTPALCLLHDDHFVNIIIIINAFQGYFYFLTKFVHGFNGHDIGRCDLLFNSNLLIILLNNRKIMSF